MNDNGIAIAIATSPRTKTIVAAAIFIIFALVLLFEFMKGRSEKFAPINDIMQQGQGQRRPIYFKPYSFKSLNYYDYPWWNTTTRNMSYDIRGDPMIIPRDYVGPWNISPHYPIQNKPLWMVS